MSIMDPMQGGAPPEMPPPPEMGGGNPMAALMGAAPPMAPPPGIAEEEAPPEEGGVDETSAYQQIIEIATQALNAPTTDQQEMAEIQKGIGIFQGLLAKNEKMLDSALGTSPQLRKALAGGGG